MPREYECVEIYPDGEELVKHTGSYQVCAHIYTELKELGFKAEIRRAGETERRKAVKAAAAKD